MLPIDAQAPPARRDAKVHVLPVDVDAGGSWCASGVGSDASSLPPCATICPPRKTVSARGAARSENTNRSARRPGAIAPRSCRRKYSAGLSGAHADRGHGVDPALGDGDADHMVNRPFVEQVGGLAASVHQHRRRLFSGVISGSSGRRFCALVACRMKTTIPCAVSRALPRPSCTHGRSGCRRRCRR